MAVARAAYQDGHGNSPVISPTLLYFGNLVDRLSSASLRQARRANLVWFQYPCAIAIHVVLPEHSIRKRSCNSRARDLPAFPCDGAPADSANSNSLESSILHAASRPERCNAVLDGRPDRNHRISEKKCFFRRSIFSVRCSRPLRQSVARQKREVGGPRLSDPQLSGGDRARPAAFCPRGCVDSSCAQCLDFRSERGSPSLPKSSGIGLPEHFYIGL